MSGANAQGRRKPLDPRIPALISNNLITANRSFFVLVGDRAKAHSQIVNLHWLLTTATSSLQNPTDGEPSLLPLPLLHEAVLPYT